MTSPGGRVVSWLLILFGVAMLGMITGALVAMVIDFLLKEGQGLGASGHQDHIVVCGWNSTARDLIDELRGDDYKQKIVVLADLDKNPAGSGIYFVRGDATDAERPRAGRASRTPRRRSIFPVDGSDEADMHSILTIMAINAVAPTVRTVAEVNNPRHEPHFQRADVDELLVTSKVASHLLARSALYPGLSGDRDRHRVGRRGLRALPHHPARRVPRAVDRRRVAPPARRPRGDAAVGQPRRPRVRQPAGRDFVLQPGDDAIVVAEALGHARAAQDARHQAPSPRTRLGRPCRAGADGAGRATGPVG